LGSAVGDVPRARWRVTGNDYTEAGKPGIADLERALVLPGLPWSVNPEPEFAILQKMRCELPNMRWHPYVAAAG
jgi:hypothetical protein